MIGISLPAAMAACLSLYPAAITISPAQCNLPPPLASIMLLHSSAALAST